MGKNKMYNNQGEVLMKDSLFEIYWPSKDHKCVLTTSISIKELKNRKDFKIYNENDNGTPHTFAVIRNTLLQPLVIIIDEFSPNSDPGFHVDIAQNDKISQDYIKYLFNLKDNEITWVRNIEADTQIKTSWVSKVKFFFNT